MTFLQSPSSLMKVGLPAKVWFYPEYILILTRNSSWAWQDHFLILARIFIRTFLGWRFSAVPKIALKYIFFKNLWQEPGKNIHPRPLCSGPRYRVLPETNLDTCLTDILLWTLGNNFLLDPLQGSSLQVEILFVCPFVCLCVCPSSLQILFLFLRDAWHIQNGWIFGKVPNSLWPPP